MTENLAAWGEGLAGLAKQWREDMQYCLKRSDELANLHEDKRSEIFLTRGRTKEICAAELEAKIAALEAASPPSTAPPDVLREIAHIAGAPEGAMPSLWPSARRERLDQIAEMALAALATPSPQAPRDSKLGANQFIVTKSIAEDGQTTNYFVDGKQIFISNVAATQENETWTGDEELDDHFRRTGLLRGSPRKVGEDGAQCEFHGKPKQFCGDCANEMVRPYQVQVPEFLSKLRDDMKAHQQEIIQRSNKQRGRARNRTRRYSAAMEDFIRYVETALDVRSSSVPVGEQK